MSIIVGSVAVEVVPDTGRFASDLRQQTTPGASSVGDELGKLIGGRISDAVAQSLRDGLRSGGTSAADEGGKTGEDFGTSFARTVKDRVEAALRSLPSVQVGVETSEADQKLQDLRAELESLRDAKIGVDLSAEEALAKVDEIKGKLDDLGAASADVAVRADTAKASAELDAVRADVDRLDGRDANVHVDVNDAEAKAKLDALQAKLDALQNGGGSGGSGGGGGGGGGGFAGGLPALIGGGALAGASLLPAVGILGAIPALTAGAGIGLAGLAAAFSGVGAAVTAYGANQAAAAQNARADAIAQANAASQVASAEDSLSRARITSKAAVLAADQAVTNAERAAATQRLTDLQSISTAEQTLQTAEYSEQQAINSVTQAQEALTAARETAKRQIEDLTQRQQDLALQSQADALNITQAQQNLTAVLANPAHTQLQVEQATLAVAQANQAYKDLQTQIQRTNQDQAAAAAAGIAGNQGVESATQSLGNAQHGVATAQQAVANAEKALAAARAKAATDQVASAQAVAAAIQKQQDTRITSALAVEAAQRQLTTALRNQANVASSTAASTLALQQAMAKLSPTGREFVGFLTGLKPVLDGLKQGAQDNLFPGLEAGIKALLPALPVFAGAINAAAKGIGDFFANFGKLIGGSAFAADLKTIFASAQGFFTSLGQVTLSLIDIFRQVGVAAGPLVKFLGDGIAGAFKNLDAAATKGRQSGGLAQFFQFTMTALHELGSIFGNVFGIIGGLLKAALPGSGGLVGGLDGLLKKLNDFVNSAAGQKDLGAIFSAIAGAFNVLAGAVTIVGQAIGRVATPIIAFFSQHPLLLKYAEALTALGVALKFLPILDGPVGLVIALGSAFIYAYDHIKPFHDAVDAVVQIVKTNLAPVLADIESFLREHFGPTVDSSGTKISALQRIFGDLQIGIRAVVDYFTANILPTLQSFLDLVKAAFHDSIAIVEDLWDRFGGHLLDALNTAWDLILKALAAVFLIFKGAFDTITALLTGNWGLFWKGLGDIFAGAWDLFLAALGLAFVALETAFGAAIALVTAVWDGLWALIQSVAADAFKAVKDTVFNGMKDANTLIVNAGKDIVKAFESIWAGITDGASKVFGTVLGFFRSGINDIIGVLNSFIHVVDDVLGAFGIPKIPAIPLLSGGAAGGQPTSTANIGFHASGGIVNTPMAIVGEGNPAHPEWVIPTDPQHRQRALGLYASLGTQLMSVGGPVGSIIGGVESGASAVGSGIRSFTGGVASGLLDVALGPVHAAVGAIPNGFIRSLADGLISKLVAGVGSFISGHGGSTGGGPIPTGQHLTLIKQALGIAGAADTGPIEAALNTIVTHESGWNPQAINLTDSNAAAGDPSRGLGQTIMSTFEAFRSLLLPDNIFDPLANLVASINYADSRYGSLLNVPGVIAESQGRGYVGYDSGGYLPPGITTVFNGTGRPEPVLTPGQLSAVASGTQGGDGAATLGLLREQNLLLRRIIAEVPEGVGRHVLAGIDGQIEQHDRAFAQVAGAQR